jgi:hypothetical protein
VVRTRPPQRGFFERKQNTLTPILTWLIAF